MIISSLPLPRDGEMQLGERSPPNLNPEFIKAFSENWDLEFIE